MSFKYRCLLCNSKFENDIKMNQHLSSANHFNMTQCDICFKDGFKPGRGTNIHKGLVHKDFKYDHYKLTL